jgi:hypothetical protein
VLKCSSLPLRCRALDIPSAHTKTFSRPSISLSSRTRLCSLSICAKSESFFDPYTCSVESLESFTLDRQPCQAAKTSLQEASDRVVKSLSSNHHHRKIKIACSLLRSQALVVTLSSASGRTVESDAQPPSSYMYVPSTIYLFDLPRQYSLLLYRPQSVGKCTYERSDLDARYAWRILTSHCYLCARSLFRREILRRPFHLLPPIY